MRSNNADPALLRRGRDRSPVNSTGDGKGAAVECSESSACGRDYDRPQRPREEGTSFVPRASSA